MCSWIPLVLIYYTIHWSLAGIWYKCVTFPPMKLIQIS